MQVYFTSLGPVWISCCQGLYPLILPANLHRSKFSNYRQLRNCPHYYMGHGFYPSGHFSMHPYLHNLDTIRNELHTLLHKSASILPCRCCIQPHTWLHGLCPTVSSPHEVENVSKTETWGCQHFSSWLHVSRPPQNMRTCCIYFFSWWAFND